MNREFSFLVDGQWKTSEEKVEIRSPYNGEVVGVTYRATAVDMEEAIQAAGRAFQQVSRLPTYRRAEILEKVIQGIQAHKEELGRLIALEASARARSPD